MASGCGGGGTPDAGLDAPSLDSGSALDAWDAVADAPVADGSSLDAPLAADAGRADAGSDAGNPCEASGGACVPVVPDSCNIGIVGDPARYACGGGVGSLCCLPISTAPFCDHIGTDQEGWYRPDGRMICNARCAGATASCQNPGTRSEGWYADSSAAACVTPAVDGLVEWVDCTP